MLNEMSSDVTTATVYFQQALQQSRDIDMQNGMMEAKAALKRLQSKPRQD